MLSHDFDDDIVDIPTLPQWIHDLEARSEQRVTGDATRMHWHIWGEGRPLALFHGGHGSWMHWVRNVDALVDAGYRVMAADLPNFGQSDSLETEDLEDFARIVAAALAELAPGEPVRMAGFSFGSVIGAITAKHVEAGVERLAMLGSPLLGDRHGVNDRLAKWRGMPIPEHRAAAHAQNVGLLMLTGPDSVTDEAVAIQMAHAELARGRNKGLFSSLDVPGDLQRMEAELTVIYGSRDALTWRYLDQRRENVAAWKPGAEFHVIPEVGHWVQYQAADEVNAILTRRMA
ncbi:alpha/beta fold hydrolase [Oceanicola sp. 22II-s10i]|uniref:alpha/beta fold hydrolase n=1 Tax=Oceanicola sp. 22II-s10i TaxID=1317116 RepID=UPI000B51F949|nr:alpha/beta fold hydrolase [Oceanicola sp. 22II-s10i]